MNMGVLVSLQDTDFIWWWVHGEAGAPITLLPPVEVGTLSAVLHGLWEGVAQVSGNDPWLPHLFLHLGSTWLLELVSWIPSLLWGYFHIWIIIPFDISMRRQDLDSSICYLADATPLWQCLLGNNEAALKGMQAWDWEHATVCPVMYGLEQRPWYT